MKTDTLTLRFVTPDIVRIGSFTLIVAPSYHLTGVLSMIRFRNARGCFIGLLLLLWLVVNAVVRTVLLVMAHRSLQSSFDLPTTVAIYFRGAVNDLFPYFLLTLPLMAFLLLKRKLWGGRTGRIITSAVFWIYACAFLFGAVAETLFWDEFGSRFNFIAVDYLIYTTEVVRNIAESYPLIPLLSAVAASAALVSLICLRPFWKRVHLPATRSPRLLAVCFLMTCSAFIYTPLTSSDRVERELSANGVWSLFSAYKNNAINYREFYPVMDDDRASACVRRELNGEGTRFVTDNAGEWRRNVSAVRPEWKPNVIQIVVESLGSDLLGKHTPNLNKLVSESLHLSRLMATGTRTVRGIEALTLSLPPTPGASIVRRPGCEGLFSTGSVFREKGYDTAFIYGGFGYFDNMNAFFSGNGFRIVDRSDIPGDAVTFTNAWGVCDEDLFHAAIRDADENFRQGRPFYQFVLTTSNHRPFTYPDGKVDIPSGTGRKGAVAYTDYAIGVFLREAATRPWFRNTVFVISGDHTSSAAGHTDLPPDRYHIPAIFYCPGRIAPADVDILCSQADIPPTLFDVLGWSYRSGFFGRSVLRMKPEEGRAWISTYQILGRLTPDSLVSLEPLQKPAVNAWSFSSGVGSILTGHEADDLVDAAVADYQTAHDLFRSERLKEAAVLR